MATTNSSDNQESVPQKKYTRGKRIYTLDLKLPEDELKTLEKLAEKQGLSLNGAVQRAIANEEYMRNEIEAGNKIIVEGRNGKSYQLTFKE